MVDGSNPGIGSMRGYERLVEGVVVTSSLPNVISNLYGMSSRPAISILTERDNAWLHSGGSVDRTPTR